MFDWNNAEVGVVDPVGVSFGTDKILAGWRAVSIVGVSYFLIISYTKIDNSCGLLRCS